MVSLQLSHCDVRSDQHDNLAENVDLTSAAAPNDVLEAKLNQLRLRQP